MYQSMCVILDMGGSQAVSVARKVRAKKVFCEILPWDAPVERILLHAPLGVIVAGGVGDPFAGEGLPPATLALPLPMLGLGCGAGAILSGYGAASTRSMPGRQTVQVSFDDDPLFEGLSSSERLIQRLDEVELPPGFHSIAREEGDWSVAFACPEKARWGVQFYPEQNDPDGLQILENFTMKICGCQPSWNIQNFMEYETARIREKAGEGRVLLALSGGVDSAVCAALMHHAVGERLHCVYVDTGFMRAGDAEAIRQMAERLPGAHFTRAEMEERFLRKIEGVRDATRKRRLISEELIRAFEESAQDAEDAGVLARGTTYDDLLMGEESPEDRESSSVLQVLEPLRGLFKSEVRALGRALGLPEEITDQQAFPGAGLAVRCMGCVTREKLSILRRSDLIFREEIQQAGLERRVRQYFALLADVLSPDAHGRLGYTVVLRAVNWSTPDVATSYRLPFDLLERVMERITGTVEGVSRVVYDLTSKPPALIEWE